MSAIFKQALSDGYKLLLDGTNASDSEDDRPGMRALHDLGILSPLRLCSLTKDKIREESRKAGLPTWNMPANACLATRVPTGERIDADKLVKIDHAEESLRSLGYSNLRVRLFHDAARVQLPEEQMPEAAANPQEIRRVMSPWFRTVLLDLEGR